MLRITPAHSDVEGAVLKLEGRMVDEWVQLFRATCEDYLSGKDTRLDRRTTPLSGFSNPAIMRISVVLPVPLGARMPSDVPNVTRNDTSCAITLRRVPVQKDLLTFSNSIMRASSRAQAKIS